MKHPLGKALLKTNKLDMEKRKQLVDILAGDMMVKYGRYCITKCIIIVSLAVLISGLCGSTAARPGDGWIGARAKGCIGKGWVS